MLQVLSRRREDECGSGAEGGTSLEVSAVGATYAVCMSATQSKLVWPFVVTMIEGER